MRETTLGRSDLLVSQIAFGTWQLGGDWGPTDEEAAIHAIRHAADRGVTLFDTAQAYGFGRSEMLLAKALDGQRDGIAIATKGGLRATESGGVMRDSSAASIREGVEHSLRALGTEAIDLYQLHWPDPATPPEETAAALESLVREGKVRHVGVSNFDTAQMEALGRSLEIETLQPPYHLFHRTIEDSVLPYAEAHDIGVLVYGPLAHGLLTGHLTADTRFPAGDWRASSPDFRGEAFVRNLLAVSSLRRVAAELGTTLSQLAVAWTLANPAVDVAIVGTRNAVHIDDAVGAADLKLEADVLLRIEDIMQDATSTTGPSPEQMPEA